MWVLSGYREAAKQRAPSVVAIGNFDGVHRGHQAIIGRLVERARTLDCRALVYTFRPHPMHVLFPQRAPLLLTTYPQKASLLRQLGVDGVVEEPFTSTYASYSPEQFVQQVLIDALQTREVWIGPDFTFGRGGSATPEEMRRLGEPFFMDVCVVEAQYIEGIRASSTRVREACTQGDMPRSASLLGRLFELSGLVVHGDARGRTLGFPTANLEPWQGIRLASGVYACWASWGLGWHKAAVHVGLRPTFSDDAWRVEAHLLDVEADLYAKPLALAFVERLRAQQDFAGVDALIAQIKQDIQNTRTLLSPMTAPSQAPWLGG